MAQPQIRALNKKQKDPKPQEKLPQKQETQPNEANSKTTEGGEEQPASELQKPKQEMATRFFQAIGVIEGEVSFDEQGFAKVTLADQEYRLKILGRKYKRTALQKYIKETGTATQRLVVYPQVIHFPEPEKQQQIQFQLLKFEKETKSAISQQLDNMEFQMAGLWQFIPVCRIPCISVFKNLTPERLEWIKQADVKQRVKFMKPAHLPLFWKDAPVKPFKYNPQAEQQEKPAFVKIKAKFLPQKNAFGFESLIEAPTTEEIPKFLKASKKDKQLVQRKKKEETNHHPVSDPDVGEGLSSPSLSEACKPRQPTKEKTTLSIEETINQITNQIDNWQEIAKQNQGKQAEIITHQLIAHSLKDENYSLPKNYISNWKYGKNIPKETSKHYAAYRLWQLMIENSSLNNN